MATEVLHSCECGKNATFVVIPENITFDRPGGWAACDLHLADAVRGEAARQPKGTSLCVKILPSVAPVAGQYVDIAGRPACGAAVFNAVCGRGPGHGEDNPHIPAAYHCAEHGVVLETWDEVRAHGLDGGHVEKSWLRPERTSQTA